MFPKGSCTQIVYTLGPMYLYREYFKAKVYTIWVHGPLGLVCKASQENAAVEHREVPNSRSEADHGCCLDCFQFSIQQKQFVFRTSRDRAYCRHMTISVGGGLWHSGSIEFDFAVWYFGRSAYLKGQGT